jgi:hypothetical protein
MRASFVLALVFVGSILATTGACSTSDGEATSPPSNGEDSGGGNGDSGNPKSDSGGVVDSGPPSGSCTALVQEGQSVDIVSTKEPQPTPTGGTPVDGKFILTNVRAFTTLFPEGYVVRAFGAYTLVLGGSGKTFEQFVTDDKKGPSKAKGNLVVSNGNEFTATPECEEPLPDAGFTIIAGKFTIEPTTLKMYVVRDFGVTAELTFTKK